MLKTVPSMPMAKLKNVVFLKLVKVKHIENEKLNLQVIPIPMPRTISPNTRKMIARVLANSGPTLDTFLQEKHAH